MISLRRSFFCSCIAMSYIEFHAPLMGHVVVGVVEVDAPLFSPQCEPALSQTNLCMILRVPTSALLILYGDYFSVHSLEISYIELYTCSMGHGVFGVEEIDAPLFSLQCEPALSQTHLCMILRVPSSAL